jgi:hypothetical protein
MGAVRRGVHPWKNLIRAVLLVVLNGMILSHSGLLSYTRFSWQAFAQSYPLGQACISATECESDFCVDGVCCNRACTAAGEVCNDPAAPGVCHGPAPVPALDGPGQVLAVLVLIGGALLGWRLRRTD